MVIILIAGASASGKSQLAVTLVQRLISGGLRAAQLKMDDYYYPKPDDADLYDYKTNANLDEPGQIEFDLLVKHMSALHRGEIIDDKPVLDFATCTRSYEKFHPCDFLVVEGIFALHLAKKLPADIKTVKVSVTTPSYMELLRRREKRDIEEGRRRTSEEVRFRERHTVGCGFFAYIAPTFSMADIQIINYQHNDSSMRHPLEIAAEEIVVMLSQDETLRLNSR